MDQEQALAVREQLDALLDVLDATERRSQDPVELVWSYRTQRDREVAALAASSVAYGRVALVRDAGRRIMEPLGEHPAEALSALSDADLTALYAGYVYRMTRGDDVADLLAGVRELQRRHGTLEAAYALGEGDPIERASQFVGRVRAGSIRQEVTRGFRYLLPDPGDGGTSKRLHLFFRWVGRGPDAIDLGLWDALPASDLMMPLDTHTSRICRYIGLGTRKSLNVRAVEEISNNLRLLDPEDPLKYDFAICHLGISGACIHERSPAHCPSCPLDTICTL